MFIDLIFFFLLHLLDLVDDPDPTGARASAGTLMTKFCTCIYAVSATELLKSVLIKINL